MGFIQDAIARARKVTKKVDVALGGHLPGGITPKEVRASSAGKPIITPKESQEGARGQVVDTTKKPSDLIPTKDIPTEPSRDVLKPEREVEVPEGRIATDVDAEVKLREQGFMTVQTGTDETGSPLTQIIPISGFKEQSIEAQKAEAELAIDILLKGAAAAPSAITAVNAFVKSFKGIAGKAGKVGKIGKDGVTTLRTTTDLATGKITSQVQVNVKTVAQSGKIVSRFFRSKALKIFGGWVALVGVGLYAQAESPEGLSIPIGKFLIPEAERTGNWTAVNEALALAEEVSDMTTWEKIIAASPFGVIAGTINKLRGNAAGVSILTQYVEDQQIKQANGETETQMWERIRQEQADQDKFTVDYYNQERKKMIQWEREATIEARNDDARFWREERVKQQKMEEEDRQAIADFWAAYRKESQRIAADNRPSNLNFGGLF